MFMILLCFYSFSLIPIYRYYSVSKIACKFTAFFAIIQTFAHFFQKKAKLSMAVAYLYPIGAHLPALH